MGLASAPAACSRAPGRMTSRSRRRGRAAPRDLGRLGLQRVRVAGGIDLPGAGRCRRGTGIGVQLRDRRMGVFARGPAVGPSAQWWNGSGWSPFSSLGSAPGRDTVYPAVQRAGRSRALPWLWGRHHPTRRFRPSRAGICCQPWDARSGSFESLGGRGPSGNRARILFTGARSPGVGEVPTRRVRARCDESCTPPARTDPGSLRRTLRPLTRRALTTPSRQSVAASCALRALRVAPARGQARGRAWTPPTRSKGTSACLDRMIEGNRRNLGRRPTLTQRGPAGEVHSRVRRRAEDSRLRVPTRVSRTASTCRLRRARARSTWRRAQGARRWAVELGISRRRSSPPAAAPPRRSFA